jgi:hypothetical protein
LLTGNVRVKPWRGALTCNKVFQKENYIKAFGNVQLARRHFIFSKYAEYSGNVKKAFATGEAL